MLNHLNVKNSSKIAIELVSNDPEMTKKIFLQKNQIGKNPIFTPTETSIISYKYKGTKINIDCVEDDMLYSFHIINKKNKESNDTCLLLSIPKDDHFVYLNSINTCDGYISEGAERNLNGSFLLDLAIDFSKNYLTMEMSD